MVDPLLVELSETCQKLRDKLKEEQERNKKLSALIKKLLNDGEGQADFEDLFGRPTYCHKEFNDYIHLP